MGACEVQELNEVNKITGHCEVESIFKSFKEEILNILGGIHDFLVPEYTSEEARRTKYRWQFYYWK